MRKIYKFLIIITFIIVSIILFNLINEINKYCNFTIKSNDKTYEIKLWSNGNDYYVFLPSFASIDEIKINSNCDVYINNYKYSNNDKLSDIKLDEDYCFNFGFIKGTIKFLKTQNIATMFINTNSGSIGKINANKNYKEKAKINLVNEKGELEYGGKLNYIKSRGNTTWIREKKPYDIQLNEEANLLNIGEAQNFVLLANFLDKTNIRNKMIFDFAKEINLDYSNDSEFVDLYINNEYAGLYLLTENIEIGKNRVDISNNDKEDITGSYIFEKDLLKRYDNKKFGFITNQNQYIVLKDYTSINDERMNYIEKIWEEAENSIYNYSEDIINYIDLDSWTKKYLLEECFANWDFKNSSAFFYKKSDTESNLIFAGPAWDYDLSLGITKKYTNPCMYIVNENNNMWNKLMKNKIFYENVKIEFNNNFLNRLDNVYENYIDGIKSRIINSAEMDMIRWKNAVVDYTDTEMSKVYFLEYDDNINYMKKYLKNRIEFLKNEWKIE